MQIKDLSPEQLAKAERLWQELLAVNAACRRLTDDLDRQQMRAQQIGDELGGLIPRPEPKLCSCSWSYGGPFRDQVRVPDPLCAAHAQAS